MRLRHILHESAPVVERWLEIEKGKWTHYPKICSRCDPDDYYEEYKKMMRLIAEGENNDNPPKV